MFIIMIALLCFINISINVQFDTPHVRHTLMYPSFPSSGLNTAQIGMQADLHVVSIINNSEQMMALCKQKNLCFSNNIKYSSLNQSR